MNQLYLQQYKSTQPERLAKNTQGGPTIDGLVTIHPSAKIHPTAKVSIFFFPSFSQVQMIKKKKKIGPNVSIGPHVVIGEGVRVKNSIILDSVQLKVSFHLIKEKTNKYKQTEISPNYLEKKLCS